jgi:hypothetical protein
MAASVLVKSSLSSGTITANFGNGAPMILPLPSYGVAVPILERMKCGGGKEYELKAKDNNGHQIGNRKILVQCRSCSGGWADTSPADD